MCKKLRFPFKGPIEGFAMNYTVKNKWRLHGHVSIGDVMSDAYKVYMECLSRYAGSVDAPEWFMALFKRSFINHFHAISKSATFLDSVGRLDDVLDTDPDLSRYGSDSNLGELLVKLSQAPLDVRQVLDFLIDHNSAREALEHTWRAQGKKKVDGNEYICRALGYNPRKVDLVSMVYKYFND